MVNLCPCGSNKKTNLCCIPIIEGKKIATTAEELMRSRYVAFTLADINYLMRSHHSKTRPIKDRKNIEAWSKSVHWMGLVILNSSQGKETDQQGMVEFRAIFMENDVLDHIHEVSNFERENDHWVYVSGIHK